MCDEWNYSSSNDMSGCSMTHVETETIEHQGKMIIKTKSASFADDYDFMCKLKSFHMMDNSMAYRRTGRTYAMAKVILEIAIETGEEIPLLDHVHPSTHNRENFENILRECDKHIMELRSHGVEIIYSFNSNRGTFQAHIHSNSQSIYDAIRIQPYQMGYRNQNPFPNKALEQRIYRVKYRLLIIC